MEELLKTPTSVALCSDALCDLRDEAQVLDYGMVIVCRCGAATVRVNFSEWRLVEHSVITLFPNDVVEVTGASYDFRTEWLRYDAGLLREASLRVEHTVYSQLRNDRCRVGHTFVSDIVNAMFAMLGVFFHEQGCLCLERLVLLQLQSFFLGYHDFLLQHPDQRPEEDGSPRVSELFNRFMQLVEDHYKQTRAVNDYAQLLHITPKYLSNIVRQKTGLSPKVIINHFTVLQIKLSLSRTDKTVRQLAYEYHFEDDAFFCHYFKKHTGYAPQQFRKRK